MPAEGLNLLGKDYFSEEEAAHYSCVTLEKFREQAALYGIRPSRFMNKRVYRRADIAAAIERGWQPSGSEEAPGFSTGTRTASVSARHSARRDLYPGARRTRSERRKS